MYRWVVEILMPGELLNCPARAPFMARCEQDVCRLFRRRNRRHWTNPLRGHSHSTGGLMNADWHPVETHLQTLTPEQVQVIRVRAAAEGL